MMTTSTWCVIVSLSAPWEQILQANLFYRWNNSCRQCLLLVNKHYHQEIKLIYRRKIFILIIEVHFIVAKVLKKYYSFMKFKEIVLKHFFIWIYKINSTYLQSKKLMIFSKIVGDDCQTFTCNKNGGDET